MAIEVTLQDLLSGYLTASAFTANNTAIEEALQKAINREGGANNAMEADLDMGLNQINNLATATLPHQALSKQAFDTLADALTVSMEAEVSAAAASASDASVSASASSSAASAAAGYAADSAASAAEALLHKDSAETAATNAEASETAASSVYSEFAKAYIGASATAPTLDREGNPLEEGALYLDTVDNKLYWWTGSSWESYASTAQGALADTAVQPADLGTAAYEDSSAFATAVQGTLADTAIQPADLGTAAYQDTSAFATAAQGTLADSAVQPSGDTISDVTLMAYTETVVAGTTAISAAAGTIQTYTMAANTTFTDSLTSGQNVTLHISGGNTYTATWPTISWIGGVAPSLSSADVIQFWKVGGTLYGAYVGSTV